MIKILKKLFFLLSPYIVFLSVPIYILILSREEFFNLQIGLMDNKQLLVGYAYAENKYPYLKKNIIENRAAYKVIALGSSRVLQFREQMFTTPFYNAGYVVKSIKDFKAFLIDIPKDKYPKYLIIALDQWMFNESWDNLESELNIKRYENFIPKIETYRSIIKDLIFKKYNLSNFTNESDTFKVGLNAWVNNTGMRNDGSYLYGHIINNPEITNAEKFSETFDRILTGNNKFQYGQTINPLAINFLSDFLDFCLTHEIQVIAFLPPFPNEVYARMMCSGRYTYLGKIDATIKPLFLTRGFEFYNFSKGSQCQSDDSEFIDGFHGGELTYLRIMISILNAGSQLNFVSDKEKLINDLQSASNAYIVY